MPLHNRDIWACWPYREGCAYHLSHRNVQDSEFPAKLITTYVRQRIKGENVLKLDYMANIFKVNGEDLSVFHARNYSCGSPLIRLLNNLEA